MTKTLIKICLLFLGILFLVQCEENGEDIAPSIQVNADIKNVSFYGLADGAIDLFVRGGIAPYIFRWSNNESTEDIDSLVAGAYVVVISDSQYHMFTDTFYISQPNPDQLTVTFDVSNPTKSGASDGTLTAKVSGGYPPYSLLWSNGEVSKTIEHLCDGIYSITATDSKGNKVTQNVMVAGIVTDVDGNKYPTVVIGEQIWMKENLKVQHAPDGSTIKSYCYNNDNTLEENYGRLYTWNVAMNESKEDKTQGICPNGWHLPSDEDFKILEKQLGMSTQEVDMVNTWRGANIGTKLKLGGSSGFDALLSGRMETSGEFSMLGRAEFLWTSTEYGENAAWRRVLDDTKDNVGRWNTFPKKYAFSVRCLKDN
ncbi:MAG TPA: FISUMP domain-containing protein [Draconibacterium sp.]|nr:FISUMP domain-containing protein [Draconibacterium sp.]